MIALTFGEPLMREPRPRAAARLRPAAAVVRGDVLVDWVRQDPAPSAAVLQGLFFGRVAPHASRREKIGVHTLIIGHGRDPIHPFSDSDALAHELPDARLIDANSIIELRVAPERLTGEIAGFIDECWLPRPAKRRPRARRASASS